MPWEKCHDKRVVCLSRQCYFAIRCANATLMLLSVLQLYNFFNDILAHVEGGQDHEFLRNLGIAPARDTTRTYSCIAYN